MKNIILICIVNLLLSYKVVYGQTEFDNRQLAIKVCPFGKNLTEEASRLLETKMQQLVTANGIADDTYSPRFVMTSKVTVINKDIIASAPMRVSLKLDVTFFIGDVMENKIYATRMITISGIGVSETKAQINAINQIQINDESLLHGLIKDAKEKIVRYYQTNGEKILSHAKLLCERGEYDKAIYLLLQVPDIDNECFKESQKQIGRIYQQRIDIQGEQLFNKAKLVWAQSPDASGALAAINLLEQINISAQCYPLIDSLTKEISIRLQKDKEQEWRFKLRQYEDRKAKEQRDFEFRLQQYKDNLAQKEKIYADDKMREQRNFEYRKQQNENELALQREYIEAAKLVAIEYAKNQPQTITKIIELW